MKLEIVKETKLNGDVYYCIEKDGMYVADSMVYVLNGSSDGIAQNAIDKVTRMYNQIKNGQTVNKEIILSEEIKTV